ncbi:MAG TPA: flavin reductase family protein [Dehalococcoidia bacterium]|nr:flavin reductase family protein [Dehalococcoidia bacterium]
MPLTQQSSRAPVREKPTPWRSHGTPRAPAIPFNTEYFTHELIADSGEFVINFMPAENADLVAKVAGCSGSDVDKFDAFEIQTTPASTVEAPVLSAPYAFYECKTIDRQSYGDHDLFAGRVTAVQWEESAFFKDGTIDLEHASPALYIGEDQYTRASQTFHHPRN